jgi:hypothetical protein
MKKLELTDTQKRKKKLGICITPFCTKKANVKHQKNKCHTCITAVKKKNNPIKYTYDTWIGNSRRRKKVNTVTFEEFLVFVGDNDSMKKKGISAKRLSIDREKDCDDTCPKEWCQAHGYHAHNIRAITVRANSIKEHMRRKKNFEDVPF